MNNEVDGNRANEPFDKNKKPFKKQDDLDVVIERRNRRLKEFFDLTGLYIRIIGDENSPAVILNDSHVLNAYVHNFELNFTDSHAQGNIIYKVKLTEKPLYDHERVMSCIMDYPKRPVYKVALEGSDPTLFLSGYNFLNRDKGLGRYPVFSAYAPKVYFTIEKATEICLELDKDGYKLSVC